MSKAYVRNIHDATPIWQVGILWAVLAEGTDTDNTFSVLWELCPQNSGATPHYHDQHEGFFVIDGSITYLVGGERWLFCLDTKGNRSFFSGGYGAGHVT